MAIKIKRANEIIGFHLGWDISDVSDGLYQPSRYASPRVYVCGDDYFCCPTSNQKLPIGFNWETVGSYYGRTVFRAEPEVA
jgi:hypothetical protein